MHRLIAFADAVDALSAAVGRSMVWAIAASVILAAFAALSRKLFGVYVNAWSELQWYLFGAAFLFSAADVLRLDEHVRVDALSRSWSDRTRAWLDLTALALVAVPTCVLMAWLGFDHAWSAFRHGERSFMPDGLAIWPVRALVPIGFALLGLQCLAEIVRRADRLRTGRQGGAPDRPASPAQDGARP
jgi:TRAP-type mannitol/chloroaromatic compound transport system permease small subunit